MSLAFQQFGDSGQPFIIMHGLFGSARNWRGIAQKLSKRFKVFTLDLRNHGVSPHADDMSYPLMAEDVAGFMNRQHIKTAHVLGHSMGGKVAMQLALDYPELVDELLVIDMAPVTYSHNFDNVLVGLRSIPLNKIQSRQAADDYLSQTLSELSLRQFLLQNLITTEQGDYQWRVNLDSIEANMPNIMGFPATHKTDSFNKPTIFIGGGQSTYLAERYAEKALSFFPSAQIEMIKGVGHWPQVESPKAFMACLNAFLEK